MLLIDVLDRNGQADPLRRPLYDTLLEDAEATRALISGYLRLLGAAHAQRGVFIADGAEWIWERSDQIRQEAEIPTRRWVEGVDFYHASEHLHDAIELGRDRNASERRQQYERLRHVLRRDADGVHKVIEALRPEARGRRGRKMNTAIDYFERHQHRMAYVKLTRRKVPVGSGPVESAIRRVINLRFKAPSTFWATETVADLMHLRAAFKCGRWHELRHRVLTQTFPVPSFARLPRDQLDTVSPQRAKEDPENPTAGNPAAGSQTGLNAPVPPSRPPASTRIAHQSRNGGITCPRFAESRATGCCGLIASSTSIRRTRGSVRASWGG